MAALSHVVHDGSDDYGLREKQVEEAEGKGCFFYSNTGFNNQQLLCMVR